MRIFVLILLVLSLCCGAVELPFDGGICQADPDGKLTLLQKNGEALNIAYNVILPKWCFYSQTPLLEPETICQADRCFELKGFLKAKNEKLPYSLELKKRGEKLAVQFTLELPEKLKTQSDLPPLLILSAASGVLDNTLIKAGSIVRLLPQDNCWGYGKVIFIQKFGLRFDLVNGEQSISVWGRKNSNVSIRIPAKFLGEKDGKRIFQSQLLIGADKMELKRPVDQTELKREQYRRVLYPPMEPEFKPRALLDILNSPKLRRDSVIQVERCLDMHSALYSLRERAVHSPSPDPIFRERLNAAYRKLNAADWQGVQKLLPGLTALAEKCPPMPMTGFNPYTWIKSFTWYGYFKHNDGCSYLEPNPYCVSWQDGLRFSIAEDPAVEQIGDFKGKGAFRQTLFKKPMEHVTVERSWVDTKWNLPGQTVTFSMLTPVIDVEGTDTLVLSGFNRPPTNIGYVDRNMKAFGGSLIDLSRDTETIASVLMGNQQEKSESIRIAGKTYWIKPHYPGRPWILLSSRLDSWGIIIIVGERPLYAKFDNGKFILKLEKKSHFGIVRLPFFRHPREAAKLAEFFAATTLAYPVGVTETIRNGTVTWKYRYKNRSDIWGTAARRIAPLSPLLQLGDVIVPGAEKTGFNTKYGWFSYVDGESVSFQLPRSPVKGHDLFGVNTGMKPAELLAHARNGANWQRLFIKRSDDPEKTYRQYEKTLKFCSEHGIKVLIDPHDFIFQVRWNQGFPTEVEKISPFVEMWNRLSQIGARYPAAVIGYDLYNELGVKEGAEIRWREVAQKCIDHIRRNDSKTPIYVTGMDGANPSGYFNYVPPEDNNLVVTFHFYSPHSFTHQKTGSRVPDDPFVFYPGYAPVMDWGKKVHYGGQTVDWYDRWSLAAIMLPVWETGISTGLPLHCGEFGVVGYANSRAEWSAFLWTRDACEIFGHAGVRWHLWNGGFGLGNKLVREYMYNLWHRSKQRNWQ